jgi:hypothetical protein
VATDKLSLLFGNNPPHYLNLDDVDELRAALEAVLPADLPDFQISLRQAIARQILDDDPPLAWETAQRLLSLGMDRLEVLTQLVAAFRPVIEAAMYRDTAPELGLEPLPVPDYEELLRQLPIPTDDQIEEIVREVIEARRSINSDDLVEAVFAELELSDKPAPVRDAVELLLDELMEADELAILPNDEYVLPEALVQGIVLTTRKTSPSEWPPLDTDLAGFGFLVDPIADLPLGVDSGDLVGARHLVDEIIVRPAPPIEDNPTDLAEIRRAYEAQEAVAGFPVSFRDLVINLLAENGDFFAEPRAPLTELVEAAGLEIRGADVGGNPHVWRQAAIARGHSRIHHNADNEDQRLAALEVHRTYSVFIDDDPREPRPTTAELRHALDLMADYDLLTLVTDQFFWGDSDPAGIEATDAFARRLNEVASRPLQRAVAAWLTAVVAERRCDPLAAAEALTDSLIHDPDYLPSIDRLAWTRFDQGRADDAKALWRQMDFPENPDLAAMEAATSANQAPAGMRRNEPCWCGSGRKYKVCHLRVTALPALPDRFKWVLQKPIAYLDRRGGRLAELAVGVAWQLADEKSENLDAAFANPLVLDVVLHELGGFRQFLTERGPILPEDEQLLYASWELVPRTLFEVVEVRPEAGLTLRDLRTGDVIDVQERMLTRTASPGLVICARVLPDGGGGNQICGGIFIVRPGDERGLIEVLDTEDPKSIAEAVIDYVAAQARPPVLQTTEGEPMMQCTRVYKVSNPRFAKMIFDQNYEASGPGQWSQTHGSGTKKIVRATLEVKRYEITVTAMSEPRIERIAAELAGLVPNARLLSDERIPFDQLAKAPQAPPMPATPEVKAMLAAYIAEREEQWCIEPVPALGGLTPQEAAADPTRREEVVRLIDSLERRFSGDSEDAQGFRPARLRGLLGLD